MSAIFRRGTELVLSSFRKPTDELEFLPAAIEVEQTPPSPAGRALLWLVISLFVLAVLWASFGYVDVVAVAQGKVIPSDRVKQIQPLEIATIHRIHVREGQKVEAGQVLVSFDTTQTQADVARLTQETAKLKADLVRLHALEDWFQSERRDTPQQILERLSAATLTVQQSLLIQQIAEFNARYQSLLSERSRLAAEQDMTRGQIHKSERILPVLSERVSALKQMYDQKYGTKEQFLALQQELIEEEQNLQIQQAQLRQLDASIQSVDGQINTLVFEQRKANLTQLNDTQIQSLAAEQELIKAQRRNAIQTLTAPIGGYVQQLAVHTRGGVVEPAQVLMQIVPEDSTLEVEAFVLNQDIGFVEEGQTVEVKIDTFNFTKYGVIDGTLTNLSEDAIQDEHLGLVYAARVALKQDGLQVENKWVRLSPGMAVTVEVKTGERRLIEYFLSPLLRYKQESVRER